jgi:hypothetical protein
MLYCRVLFFNADTEPKRILNSCTLYSYKNAELKEHILGNAKGSFPRAFSLIKLEKQVKYIRTVKSSLHLP